MKTFDKITSGNFFSIPIFLILYTVVSTMGSIMFSVDGLLIDFFKEASLMSFLVIH